MASEDLLRTEIIEAEKARTDFQKWKLILVASLGAVAIGIGAQAQGIQTQVYLPLLCVIPGVCSYVDLLCAHTTLRILVIAAYLRSREDPYETFMKEKIRGKVHAFVLEDLVMYGSSLVLCLFVIIYGAMAASRRILPVWPYPISGFAGLMLSGLAYFGYRAKAKKLTRIGHEGQRHG
jgi:hypothetical protein